MKLGNLDKPITIDGTQAVVYDSGELTSAVTSIDITGLNGDVDEEYYLIARIVNNYNGATDIGVRPNNDTGSNYGSQYLDGNNTDKTAARNASQDIMWLGHHSALNDITLNTLSLKAKSGFVRTAIVKCASSISTTTVTSVNLAGRAWNNTANNITSLVVLADQTNGIGVGSRIILLKKVTATEGIKTGELDIKGKVYGTWQEIYSTTLTAAATSVTVSDLKGDTDVLYRVRTMVINGYNGAINLYVRPNNDSGANYGRQILEGSDTTAAAARQTNNTSFVVGNAGALNAICQSNLIFSAKSGYVRTGIIEFSGGIATTTVTSIDFTGNSWNNTADEITSLVFLADQTNGLGSCSNIVVERLNL